MAAPNILLIMTDQQRFDSPGCYGFEAANTPNLDRLAAEGVLFEHCYVNNPICTPSRASLMTGKHLPGHGVYRLFDILSPDQVLFTERLRALNYTTALFGKLHVSSNSHEARERHPHDGFDVYEWTNEGPSQWDSPLHAYRQWIEQVDPAFGERLRNEGRGVKHHPREVHFTHWAAERTIDFIQRQTGEQPFFAMMSIFDPHNPYDLYPPDVADKVDRAKVPPPDFTEVDAARIPTDVRREMAHNYFGRYEDFSADDIAQIRWAYHTAVAYADEEIGRVLAALADKGFDRDTLVIFSSDHGDMLGDRRLFVKGAFFYEANVRVPLLMRWPARFEAGRRVAGLVQLHDLAATIMDAAGATEAERAAWMPDAASLLPLADGAAERVRDYAVCCYRNSGRTHTGYYDPPINGTMYRDERYKLNLFHTPPAAGTGPEGELYDMVADPGERVNLWDDPAYAGIRVDLTARLADWLMSQERGSWGGEKLD
jgi:arylsulfatase